MVVNTIAGTAQSQINDSEFQDIHRKNLQREQKEALKNYLELSYNNCLKIEQMKKVKVIVERGSDDKYSAYMDYYDFDFGLAGFGDSERAAIEDFYKAYEEEKIMCTQEGKVIPELEFEIQQDVCSFAIC